MHSSAIAATARVSQGTAVRAWAFAPLRLAGVQLRFSHLVRGPHRLHARLFERASGSQPAKHGGHCFKPSLHRIEHRLRHAMRLVHEVERALRQLLRLLLQPVHRLNLPVLVLHTLHHGLRLLNRLSHASVLYSRSAAAAVQSWRPEARAACSRQAVCAGVHDQRGPVGRRACA